MGRSHNSATLVLAVAISFVLVSSAYATSCCPKPINGSTECRLLFPSHGFYSNGLKGKISDSHWSSCFANKGFSVGCNGTIAGVPSISNGFNCHFPDVGSYSYYSFGANGPTKLSYSVSRPRFTCPGFGPHACLTVGLSKCQDVHQQMLWSCPEVDVTTVEVRAPKCNPFGNPNGFCSLGEHLQAYQWHYSNPTVSASKCIADLGLPASKHWLCQMSTVHYNDCWRFLSVGNDDGTTHPSCDTKPRGKSWMVTGDCAWDVSDSTGPLYHSNFNTCTKTCYTFTPVPAPPTPTRTPWHYSNPTVSASKCIADLGLPASKHWLCQMTTAHYSDCWRFLSVGNDDGTTHPSCDTKPRGKSWMVTGDCAWDVSDSTGPLYHSNFNTCTKTCYTFTPVPAPPTPTRTPTLAVGACRPCPPPVNNATECRFMFPSMKFWSNKLSECITQKNWLDCFGDDGLSIGFGGDVAGPKFHRGGKHCSFPTRDSFSWHASSKGFSKLPRCSSAPYHGHPTSGVGHIMALGFAKTQHIHGKMLWSCPSSDPEKLVVKAAKCFKSGGLNVEGTLQDHFKAYQFFYGNPDASVGDCASHCGFDSTKSWLCSMTHSEWDDCFEYLSSGNGVGSHTRPAGLNWITSGDCAWDTSVPGSALYDKNYDTCCTPTPAPTQTPLRTPTQSRTPGTGCKPCPPKVNGATECRLLFLPESFFRRTWNLWTFSYTSGLKQSIGDTNWRNCFGSSGLRIGCSGSVSAPKFHSAASYIDLWDTDDASEYASNQYGSWTLPSGYRGSWSYYWPGIKTPEDACSTHSIVSHGLAQKQNIHGFMLNSCPSSDPSSFIVQASQCFLAGAGNAFATLGEVHMAFQWKYMNPNTYYTGSCQSFLGLPTEKHWLCSMSSSQFFTCFQFLRDGAIYPNPRHAQCSYSPSGNGWLSTGGSCAWNTQTTSSPIYDPQTVSCSTACTPTPAARTPTRTPTRVPSATATPACVPCPVPSNNATTCRYCFSSYWFWSQTLNDIIGDVNWKSCFGSSGLTIGTGGQISGSPLDGTLFSATFPSCKHFQSSSFWRDYNGPMQLTSSNTGIIGSPNDGSGCIVSAGLSKCQDKHKKVIHNCPGLDPLSLLVTADTCFIGKANDTFATLGELLRAYQYIYSDSSPNCNTRCLTALSSLPANKKWLCGFSAKQFQTCFSYLVNGPGLGCDKKPDGKNWIGSGDCCWDTRAAGSALKDPRFGNCGACTPTSAPTPPATPTPAVLPGCSLIKNNEEYITLPPTTICADFTIEGYFRLDASPLSCSRLFDFGLGENQQNIWVGFCGTPFLSWSVLGSTGVITYSHPYAAPVGRFFHIALRCKTSIIDGTTDCDLVLDGLVVSSAPASGTLACLTRSQMFIGRSNWAADPLIDLTVSTFRIWNTYLSDVNLQAVRSQSITAPQPDLAYFANYGPANCPKYTATPTPTPSALPSATPSPSALPSATRSPSALPSATPSPSATALRSPSPTLLPSVTPSPSALPSASALPSPSALPSATRTPTLATGCVHPVDYYAASPSIWNTIPPFNTNVICLLSYTTLMTTSLSSVPVSDQAFYNAAQQYIAALINQALSGAPGPNCNLNALFSALTSYCSSQSLPAGTDAIVSCVTTYNNGQMVGVPGYLGLCPSVTPSPSRTALPSPTASPSPSTAPTATRTPTLAVGCIQPVSFYAANPTNWNTIP
eukprot:CAMPEP_0184673256 /NCGR_PEP_ID=MMETSP0308-20130426/86575_1 /TAXON_ID=38269 /ORGANISM="Gloeochaete witrockiana, Strain SAG 46.84" /LENGTH=1691 /DNA_ID=CAMNT_0027120723 /DNA_START=260 /DNA_END=5331 /DNA_ORIENTATION=-